MWNPTHVQVTVHRAKSLISKGKAGTNDSYVTIHLGKEKYQTSVKEKSMVPEWNEECDLLIPDKKAGSEIKLTVFHRNLLGLDQFLGCIALPLNEFQIYERPRSRWYTLRNKPDSKKPAKNRGEIEVKVTFIVQSTPAASTASLSKTSLSSSALSLSMLKKSRIKSLATSMGEKMKVKSNLLKSSSKTDLSRSRESIASNQSSNVSSLTQSSLGDRTSPVPEKTQNKTHQGLPGILPTYPTFVAPTSADHSRQSSLSSHVNSDTESDQVNKPCISARPPRSLHPSVAMATTATPLTSTPYKASPFYRLSALPDYLNPFDEPKVTRNRQRSDEIHDTNPLPSSSPSDHPNPFLDPSTLSAPEFSGRSSSSEDCNSFEMSGIAQDEEFNPVKEEPSERLDDMSSPAAMHCRATSLGSQRVAQSMLDLRSSKVPEVVVDKPPVIPSVEQSRMTRSAIDLGDRGQDTVDCDERSLYGRGRFSTQSHDLVKKPANGESINSLNILTEESTSPPSEPTENQVWSSSIEQQNAANIAHSPRAKSDVISDDVSETDSCENMMSRGNSRPTSTIIEGPIDFRRLSSGSREGKDERRSSLRYGMKEIVTSVDADLYEVGDYKQPAIDDHRSLLPAEILGQYKSMTREDLIRMAYTQKVQLEKKETYIKEMESYLDNLLVRVIETSPTILQNPYEKKSPVAQTRNQGVLQRPLLRTGKVTLPGTTPLPVTAVTIVPPRTKGTNRTVPPKVVTHSRKAVKPNALKNPKKSLANPFKKISAALK